MPEELTLMVEGRGWAYFRSLGYFIVFGPSL